MTSDNRVTTYPLQPPLEPELNLVDIAFLLFRKKYTILTFILLTVLAGGLYVSFLDQVYEVETRLLPPSLENIEPLNILRLAQLNEEETKVPVVKRIDVFNLFISRLQTRKLKKTFFDKIELVKILSGEPSEALTDTEINDYLASFSESIKINVDKKTNVAHIYLTGTHREKIGKWLDGLVALAALETKAQLVSNLDAKLHSIIKSLKIKILSKKSSYKQRRKDELARLQEAYEIAKSLGIHNYSFVSKGENIGESFPSLFVYMDGTKAYMKGTKALQAEIKALLKRKSDDLYIVGLRDLEELSARLESIKINESRLQTVIVDKPADTRVNLIKPNKTMVIFIALVLGGILGIFTVFLQEFIVAFQVKNGEYKASYENKA